MALPLCYQPKFVKVANCPPMRCVRVTAGRWLPSQERYFPVHQAKRQGHVTRDQYLWTVSRRKVKGPGAKEAYAGEREPSILGEGRATRWKEPGIVSDYLGADFLHCSMSRKLRKLDPARVLYIRYSYMPNNYVSVNDKNIQQQ